MGNIHTPAIETAPELFKLRVLTTKALTILNAVMTLVFTGVAFFAGNNALGVLIVGCVTTAGMSWYAWRDPASQ